MKDTDKSDALYPNGFFDIEGRIGRTKYAVISLLALVITSPLYLAIGNRNTFGQLLLIGASFLVLAPTVVKRLHDIDRNGTWVWALFIPFVNVIIQLRLLFQAGTPHGNQFGIQPNMETGHPTRIAIPNTNQYARSTQPDENMDRTPSIEKGTLTSQYPYGIVFSNGMYQFRDSRFEMLSTAITSAERILANEPIPKPRASSGIDEDAIYKIIAQELETGSLDKGLWIRLFSECDGNETKTKVRYIKDRAARLIKDQHDLVNQSPTNHIDNVKAIAPAPSPVQTELSPRERELEMQKLIGRMK